MQNRELEICVETLQACHAASLGGADRIELCAALGEGGVTPSRGFLGAALTLSEVPVHTLIRPRAGDFLYSGKEFEVMLADVDDALAAGCAGIVIGLLTPEREIDHARTASLIRRAHGSPVTFHRAFDHTVDLCRSLEILIDLGCSRVLTSGGKLNVIEGRETLSALSLQAAGRLRIAAGGGVTLGNASHFVDILGLDLHASLRSAKVASQASDPLWKVPAAELSVQAVQALSAIVHDTSI